MQTASGALPGASSPRGRQHQTGPTIVAVYRSTKNGDGRRHLAAARPFSPQVFGWLMFTSHGMPNLSVQEPNSSPHICFSSGMVTLPPAESFSQ